MISLTRRVHFCAAHRYALPGQSPEESERLFGRSGRAAGHGHNYEVEVTVTGPLDPVVGMVVDLAWLDAVLAEEVVEPFDHSFLNEDVPAFAEALPTTENLAREIWRRLAPHLAAEGGRRLVRVRVHEDATLSAECEGEEERQ